MKRIYLLMIAMVALVGTASAQIDLAYEHYWTLDDGTGSGTRQVISDNDSFFVTGGSGHPFVAKYSFTWTMWLTANTVDTLLSTDYIFVAWRFDQGLPTRGNLVGVNGLGMNDTIQLTIPNDGSFSEFTANSGIASSVSTVQWCDSLWAQSDTNRVNGTPYTDLNVNNNFKCNSVINVRWASASVNGIEAEPNKVHMFPNPATNRLELHYNFVKPASNVNIVVTNAAGQVVLNESYNGSFSGTNKFNLDVAKLPAGMHFVRLSADNGDVLSDRFNIIK